MKSGEIFAASSSFVPTPESFPPNNYHLRLRLPPDLPVNLTPLNPLSFLLKAASLFPDKIALVHPEVSSPRVYTYAVWSQRIQNLAYALIQQGIKPGDRVAVIAPNSPLIADAHHGILAARAVITPINTRLTKAEVDYIVNHSGSKLVLVDYEFLSLVDGSTVPVVVSHDTGTSDDPYKVFLASGRRFSAERGWAGLDIEPHENATATLCYTSGTTGRPKGVASTYRGTYLAAIANACESLLTKDSVYLWVLPMFHAAGWTYPWSITFGMATQITLRTVDNSHIWKHLKTSRVTHYCGAPTVQIGIVNAPEAQVLPEGVQAIVAGSAPTATLISQMNALNIQVVHVYGLTETYGPFTRLYLRPEWADLSLKERAKYIARQGHAFATADEARVVFLNEGDDDLVDVPSDGKTIGEVITRGNITMKEYFQDPEATKEAFRGGSFHSGDLAVRYPDGSIAIVDRSKDLIISGGENASSLSIEQELATHPDVFEVSVVARAHHKWGERPMAFVTLKPHAADKWAGKGAEFETELKKYSRERLPGFARPEWVYVLRDLPKTSTGKIRKTELRRVAAKL